MLADLMARAMGESHLLRQDGVDRVRRWLTHNLWAAGSLTLRVEGRTVAAGSVPARDDDGDRWEPDTTHVTFEDIVFDSDGTDTEGEDDDDDENGGGGGGAIIDLTAGRLPPPPPPPGADEDPEARARAARGVSCTHQNMRQQTLVECGIGREEDEALQHAVPEEIEEVPQLPELWQGMWGPEPQWPREEREQGNRGVIQHGDWELGGPWWGSMASYVTWNVGPLGWFKSTDDLFRILQTRPTVVTLQDVRMGRKGLKSIRGWLRAYAPLYLPFLTTQCKRVVDEDGHIHRYWYGVVTLLHKEARPQLKSVTGQALGLGAEDARFIEGRVLVNLLPSKGGGGRGTAIINVYQYQAQQPAEQLRLWTILAALLRTLKAKCTTVFVSGDMNAALYGGRRGYSGDFEEVDKEFQKFVRDKTSASAITRLHTRGHHTAGETRPPH